MTLRKLFSFALILFWTFAFLFLGQCSASDKPTIAVLRFENKSIFDRLDAFEVALPYMVISDLSKISGIQLVERDKIDKLMAETGLAEKDLMDPATMQRAGKALGADFIVTGSFREEIESGKAIEEMGESKLTLNVQVRDVVNEKVTKEIKVSGKTKEFFKIEKEVIQELIKILNMSLTKEARKEVECISTQSLEAVLHFGRGEKFAIMSGHHRGWRGMVCGEISEEEREKLLLQAISEFRQAVYLDPQYADAQYAIAITFANLAGVASAGREKMDKYLPSEMAESEKFISQFPDDARCPERLTRLGHVCFDRGYMNYADHAKAAEYFDKAVQWYRKRIFEYGHVQDGLIDATEKLAYTFQYKGDYSKAIEIYEHLIKHYPEKKGDYKRAISMYEASLERVGPDLHLEERIPICREKLAMTQKGKLLKWAFFSPIRERNKRFITQPSIRGTAYKHTCITTWGHSVWIPFATSHRKMDSGGNFEFKITARKYPPWYLYCLNLDSMTEKIIEIPDAFEIGWDEISDIAVDDKEIWLSCGKGGIVCYDRVLEKWAHFTTDNGLIFNTAHCLALSQGMVWCGFGEKGRGAVMAYDRGQKKWFFYNHPIVTATKVTSLVLYGDNLWVGNDEGTISILNTVDFSWRILHQDKKGYTSTVEDIFVCKDVVWFACHFSGIRRYHKETGKWKIWDWDEPDLDCSLALKCVTVDGGDVWVGGNGSVYKLDTLSDRFTKVDAGRFLKLSGASSIAVSDRFIWFINPGTLYNTIVHIKGGIVEDALKVDVK